MINRIRHWIALWRLFWARPSWRYGDPRLGEGELRRQNIKILNNRQRDKLGL